MSSLSNEKRLGSGVLPSRDADPVLPFSKAIHVINESARDKICHSEIHFGRRSNNPETTVGVYVSETGVGGFRKSPKPSDQWIKACEDVNKEFSDYVSYRLSFEIGVRVSRPIY